MESSSYTPLPPPNTVQLNVGVSHDYREQLRRLAASRDVPLAQLCREALEEKYPPDTKAATRKAGATK